MPPQKIDTHLHIITPLFTRVARSLSPASGGTAGQVVPSWSPSLAIQFMDKYGIKKGLMSFTSPGPLEGGKGVVREGNVGMRDIADYDEEEEKGKGEKKGKSERRFGWFASLPDWDAEEGVGPVIEEIEWALGEAGADGVSVMTSYGDKFPGHEKFRPIWEKLDEMGAIVQVHPTQVQVTPRYIASEVAQPILDYTLATTRAATDLILTGTMSRYTNLKIILSHTGGTFPYIAERIITQAPDFDMSKDECRRAIRRFYAETAMSTSKAQLMAVTAILPPDHLLWGSDWPYNPESDIQGSIDELDEYINGGCICGVGHPDQEMSDVKGEDGVGAAGRKALVGIWADNAEKLFGWGKYAVEKK